MLTNARIKRYVSFGKYADNSFVDMFREAGISFEQMPKPSNTIVFLD
jgi:dCMP deaminase